MNISSKPFSDLQSDLFGGKLKVEDVVNSALLAANTRSSLNAYVELYSEEAIKKARDLDANISSKKPVGKLCGLVISVKDVIAMEGKMLTAASKILEGYISPFTATVIQRLIEEDAIVIGRTNCDEFAMGSANANSIYGPSANALDENLVPGGSSGGTAISVSIDSCHVGVGSDTGGSIRQPAAYHGLYGFKPSYGRYSRYGLISYASSFDQIGFITKDHSLIALLHDIVNGPDHLDSTLLEKEIDDVSKSSPLKVGFLSDAFQHNSLDAAIKTKSLEKLSTWAEKSESFLKELSFRYLDYLVPTYYVLASAEASSNLSRYDGVRYGYRDVNSNNLDDMYRNTRTSGFGREVKRRLMMGTFVLSSGYYDAYFDKAQRMRRLLLDEITALFEEVDLIALPISPVLPWARSKTLRPVEIYLLDIFSVMANLLGAPSCVVPINHIEGTNELPISVQFIGHPTKDLDFLRKVKEFTTL